MKISSPAVRHLLIVTAISLAAIGAQGQPASTWVQLSPKHSPTRRAACAMAYDPVSQKIVMFGGFYRGGYYGDTWTFDGTDWKRQKTAVAPSARAAAALAFDSTLQKLILFGGWDGQQYLGDTWEWDGATASWTPTSPAKSPKPMTGPMVFTDPRTGRVDTYGGFDGRFYSLTTWRWRDGSWHKLFPDSFPSARGSAVLATDPVRKQTVLFGGLADVNPNNTWTYDGKTWTQQFPSSQPSYRFFAGATYDPRFEGVLAFGGFSGGDVNDTWLWNGSDWLQVFPASAPPGRESLGMAFDGAHQQTVIFGGLNGGTLLRDTWALLTTN